jgi:hypothetical protein
LASIIAVGALTAVSAIPAGAAVDDNKTYTVASTASVSAGDRDAKITITINNTSQSQSLGSANLTLPTPDLTLASAAYVAPRTGPADAVPGDNVVQLRNLGIAPGGSASVEVTVDVRRCTSITTSFTVTAKQSNDYLGTGNDFYPLVATNNVAVTGQCQLRFVGEPADALRNTTITTVDYQPTAAAVSVEVLDASGTGRVGGSTPVPGLRLELATNPGGITPAPTFSPTSFTDGLAKFAPQLGVSAFDYSLRPAATDLDPQPASGPFDVVDQHVTCEGNGGDCPKTEPVSKGGVSVSTDFGTGPDPANLTVSIGAGDAPDFNCEGYPRNNKPISQFVFTPTDGSTPSPLFAQEREGTFTMSFPDASRPLNSYEVCWAAPYQFQMVCGSLTVESIILNPGNTTNLHIHVGLLPVCKRGTPLPCVASRSFKKATGSTPATVTIVVNADGRDPWRY